MYMPDKGAHLTTAFKLQVPSESKVNGVLVKNYTDAPQGRFFANFSSYGGTETTSNGVLAVEDTATVTTRFRPDIKSNSRIVRLADGAVFDVIAPPENIELRNVWLVFKVRRVRGGA